MSFITIFCVCLVDLFFVYNLYKVCIYCVCMSPNMRKPIKLLRTQRRLRSAWASA